MFRVLRFAFCVSALALLLLPACQQKPKTPVPALTPDSSAAKIAEENALIIELATDPCAVQMQEIAGALAIYYHEHQGFPQSLEAIRPIAQKWNLKVNFICPASGEPYIYIPAGLGAPGQSRRLVLYDKSAAHKGWRWGVVMSPPPQGMVIVTPEVIRLSEPVLEVYLKSDKPAPTTP